MTAGDTVKVTFNGKIFLQQIVMDLTYRCTVGNALLTTAQVLDELNIQLQAGGANDIVTNYLKCLPPQYTLFEVRSQVLRPVRSAFRSVFPVGAVGTNANAATVGGDSAAVIRRTALSGRSQVSVLKLGPMPDAGSAAGLLTPAYTGVAAAFGLDSIKTLLLPVSTCQFVATILNRGGFDTGRDLSNIFVPPESRVMRRRVVGRGK